MDKIHTQMDENVEIHAPLLELHETIVTREALAFVIALENKFGDRAKQLVNRRKERAEMLRQGHEIGFRMDTKHIRDGDWKVAPIPADLLDRRVEITGPAERKMIINALNSDAKVFMADIEDSLSPRWMNVFSAQVDLRDAVNGTIEYINPETDKEYKLNKDPAVLIVRPRGWHLDEKHILLDGKPIRGALMDFGFYFFHNAKTLIAKGSGPYFYLPKLENYEEALLWNDVFVFAQEYLDLPVGTIKATVLIETITAAFEMDEILYALKDHIVAQNAGRWDYIFSYIKKHAYDPKFVCPERGQVLMTQHFLRSYSQLLIQTCHKRGALAMGGMSAFIPIKNDKKANDAVMAAVKADKEREASDGHDGTWVAHPGLIPTAMEVFDRLMPGLNQVANKRDDVEVKAADLLAVPEGTITEHGLRNNIAVALHYISAWLGGNGCVPIFNLMEDAATAEISRTQIWQWLKHEVKLNDGRVITPELFLECFGDECASIRLELGEDVYCEKQYDEAAELLKTLVEEDEISDFLTTSAYEKLE
jgi:malate synthase